MFIVGFWLIGKTHLGICSSVSIFKLSWLWLKASLLLEIFLGWLLIRAENTFKQLEQPASLVAQLVKNPPAMQETPSLIPRLGRSPGEGIGYPLQFSWASLVAQMVKNPMQEVWIQSLVWEGPLEEDMATHSSILCLENPVDRGAWRLQSMGSQRVGHDWAEQERYASYTWPWGITQIFSNCQLFFSYFKWHVSTSESVLIHGPFHFSKFVPPCISS